MKAIILAAGRGTRLKPLTDDIPKCMIKLFDKTLLERQIEIYRNCGINDITIVTGYKSDIINFSDVKYIKNEKFATTNMNTSFFCASEILTDIVIVSYADIVFEQKIIEQMMEISTDIAIAVKLDWKKNYEGRTAHPLSEAENVLIDNEKILQIKKGILGNLPNQKIGEFLGIIKLSKNGGKSLVEKYNKLKETHQGSFHNANSLDTAYITDMLQEMIDSEFNVLPVIVKGNWYEIDTKQDLDILEKKSMFN